jgi:RNA polymerase sigma factor (sigma-70 family)
LLPPFGSNFFSGRPLPADGPSKAMDANILPAIVLPSAKMIVAWEAMITHPDQRYLEGLLQNNTILVQEIYQRFAPKIKYHILQNQGSEDDAADIFQESLIDIYNQAKHKNLQLTCPFEPFLLLVCKRKWLNEIKKRGLRQVTKSTDDVYDIGEDVFAAAEQVEREEAKARMYLQQFERLGEKCKEILRRSLTGEAQEKIATALGVTYGYLRKKKSECMATLLSFIQAQNL